MDEPEQLEPAPDCEVPVDGCSFKDCKRPPTRRGLCDAHFTLRPDLRRY